MADTLYQDFVSGLRVSFNGPGFRRVWRAFAKVIGDNSLRDIRNALLVRLPGFAEADANGFNANDRLIERGPTETDAGFAARLVAAPNQWRVGGTPLGLLIQLYYLGFPGAVIVQQNGLGHTLSSAPVLDDLAGLQVPAGGFTAAGGPNPFPTLSWYSRVQLGNYNPPVPASTDGKAAIPAMTVPWAAFAAPMDAAGNQYNSRFVVLFPAPTTVDLSVADNLARIRRIIAAWRPARATCFLIVVGGATGKVWGWPVRKWHVGGDKWHAGTVLTYSA